jgi:photosystem II stability/assembly factor-like uncharacterized protein
MPPSIRTLLVAAICCAFTAPAVRLTAQDAAPGLLDDLPWRAIGPAVMGGRIDDVAVDEANPSIMYLGTASGGVWKTTNRGTTWTPLFDDQPVASIGDLAIGHGNSSLVWVGTGEPNNRQSSSFGDGVYKSTDGGRTWAHMGLADTQAIGRIVIDPVDAEVVYVAAVGHLWGPNKERGLFKTSDGGRTWVNTNFIDEDTGFTDVVMDPRNRTTLYAAAYQRRRTPWGFNGGGPGSGIYKTTDGGASWTKLTRGLPEGPLGRIGLDISRSNPQVVYATVEHREGGIFRSDDGGGSWRRVNRLNPRPMYYSQIRVDPRNDQRIYVLGAPFYVSNDGGRTFEDPVTGEPGPNTTMSPSYDIGVHGDHHALWINPNDTNHLVLGTDGGLYVSYDGSIGWDKFDNIPLGQFYGVGVDMDTPYNIYGGLQDTHSWGGPSATRQHIGIVNADWFQTNFGDGHYARPDPADTSTVYTESQDGNLSRFDRRTGDRKAIKPQPEPGDDAYRFNWTSPLVISPHDSTVLYFGGNRLFRSSDRGESWTASDDLTRNEDRSELEIMGVRPEAMLSRNDGVSAWGTITSVDVSPVKPGVIWVGTDDGYLQLSTDDGQTWINATDRVPGPERKGRVSRVVASRRDEQTAYVAFDRHQDDDFAPYLFVTRDLGKTWTSIAGTLPKVGWINVVAEHHANPSLLFVGTETGLFASLDGGARWHRFTGAFPTVPVDDLVVHPRDNDLVVATHGRSIYVLDDIEMLSGAAPEALDAPAHLFKPRAATVRLAWKHESYGGQRQFVGPNPPAGLLLTYHLNAEAPEGVTLTIRDGDGTALRTLEGPGHAGYNRVAWDLRAAVPDGAAGGRGPYVVPGAYAIELSAPRGTSTQSAEVAWDPDAPTSPDEARTRFTFLGSANELLATLGRLTRRLGAIVSQLEPVEEQLRKLEADAAIVAEVAAALEETRRLSARIAPRAAGEDGEGGGGGGAGLRRRVTALVSEIDGGGVQQGTLSGPTPSQQRRLEAAADDAEALTADGETLVSTTIPALSASLDRAGVPRIRVP